MPEETGRWRELGIDGCLMKPASPSDLLDTILRLFSDRPATGGVRSGTAASPGKGAGAAGGGESPARGPQPQKADGLRVLLAEDNFVNQKLAIRLLERRGHQVQLVETGREALELHETGRFDLVLMDIQMPEMDGIAATRAIREREAKSGGHIPIVAMTAHAMKGDRERCLEAGMDDYLAKPVHPEVLEEVIARVTAGRERRPGERAVEATSAPELGPEEFDREQALLQFDGDAELLEQTVRLFLDDARLQLSRIQEGLAGADAQAVERGAHSLKGAASNFAAGPLVAAAQQVEELGRRKDLGAAASANRSLRECFERLRVDFELRILDRAA